MRVGSRLGMMGFVRLAETPPRALLLDLDGTLVDSLADIAASCNVALRSVGARERSAPEIAGFVGDGATQLLARALDCASDEPIVRRALACFRSDYETRAVEHTALLPGAREALAHFRAIRGLGVALVTNKPRLPTLRIVEALGLAGTFDAISAGGDAALKPSPALLELALDRLGAPAAGAIMVGDGPQDIVAGRAAGCRTIAIRGGFGDDAAVSACEPDATFDSLAAFAIAELAMPEP